VVDAIRNIKKNPFEMLFDMGIHQGKIIDSSICISKSIILTIAED